MPSIAVLCHLYYEDSLEGLLPYLKNLCSYKAQFLFNLCCDTTYYHDVKKKIYASFKNAVIIATPNIGKDIGGKLALIDTYLKRNLNSDYLIVLHDKKSLHTATGSSWRTKLLTILEPQNIDKALAEFKLQKDVGLIANKDLILNEFDNKSQQYASTSNAELQLLRNKHEISTGSHEFVGGTMFWVRASLFKNFFTKFKPLDIRTTLERGNILDHQRGSYSHAWERMLSWIVLNEGFKIKGI